MSTNMLKVVYFDEGSAIDYLDIFNGGLKNTISSKEDSNKTQDGGSGTISANTGVLFKALKPFLDLSIGGKLETSFSKIGESAVKATISNTVLSDFIKLAEEDNNIEKSKNYKVSAHEESITFMKMYSPYFNMIELHKDSELNNSTINFQKVDETLEKGKGYYELIGKNGDGNKIVLRFNIKAFRNNYSLVDLTRMNLVFYSVNVGIMKIENLNASNEFDFKKKEKIVTSQEIIDGSDIKNENEDSVNVYDVILAGIKL